MELFDIALYTAAILLVLIVRANPTPATVAPQPEPITEAPQPIEAKPEPQPIAPAMAQTITEPVVSLTIPTESSTATEAPADLASMTSAQLRKECSTAGIRWRNAHGKGKHLSKAAMLQALA